VREIIKNDLAAISKMSHEFVDYLNKVSSDADVVPLSEKILDEQMFSQSINLLRGNIAEINNDAVGYILYYYGFNPDIPSVIVHIADLYVNNNHRNKGIGKKLVNEVARTAKQNGARQLHVHAWVENPKAIKFYESMKMELIDFNAYFVMKF
jgi:ribosomal protein S18 acetylase RimI-like enzyme